MRTKHSTFVLSFAIIGVGCASSTPDMSSIGSASTCSPACDPTTEVCVQFPDGSLACALSCATNTDCATAYCATLATGGGGCVADKFCMDADGGTGTGGADIGCAACSSGAACVRAPDGKTYCVTPYTCGAATSCSTACCGQGDSTDGTASVGALCIDKSLCASTSTSMNCINPTGGFGSCIADTDCCTNHCEACFCQPGVKFDERCGGQLYCSFGFCNAAGICACKNAAEPCGQNGECCTQYCVNGTCSPNGVMPVGAPCSENRWCKYSLCENGRCAETSCTMKDQCSNFENYCTNGSGCCSGVCGGGNLCSCLDVGMPCQKPENCCHLSCADDGTGILRCL